MYYAKKIAVLIFVAALILPQVAECRTKTLGDYFGNDLDWSVAASFMVGDVNGNTVPMNGMRVHGTLNKEIGFGFFGYGTCYDSDHHYMGANRDFEMNLYGFDIEYTINPDDLVHWVGSLAFGGGDLDFSYNTKQSLNYNPDDKFFFVQPMVYSEINVIRHLKLNVGAGYRQTSGVNSLNIDNNDLSGWLVALNLKII